MNKPVVRRASLLAVYAALLIISTGMLIDRKTETNEHTRLLLDSFYPGPVFKSGPSISTVHLEIEHYPPDYALYRPVHTSIHSSVSIPKSESVDYELVCQVS